MTDTNKHLLDYVHHGSESAFRELVTRYVDLVYSVALRRTSGNVHSAEDVTQSVFTDLACKARALPPNVMLGGWLHRHTCFTASNLLRAEARRHHREREAAQMNTLHATPNNAWLQLGPVLDEAIDQLESADREAIVLRYFEQRDLRAVGAALGIGEDAAQKRVSRAVDKLRELVTQQGATLSATVLVAALASGAVAAAPASLARKVSSAALAAAGAGLGIVGGLLALAAAAKIKLAVAAVVIVAATAIPLLLQKPGDKEQNPAAALALANHAPDEIAVNTNAASEALTNITANAPTTAKPKESGLLRLKIVTADSGQPIPNVPLDYRRWDGDKFTGRKLQSTRFGDCEVSFPRETTTQLELTTRVEGFADTRLRWRKDRGDEIPGEYTVRVERGVPIGGTVVDADGNPVAGAKVGFNHNDDPTSIKWPQDQEFSWIEVNSDETGRWRINRMADEVIRRIYGSARHPEHVDTVLISLSRDREAERKLREESFVFQLGRPVQISGVVVDADGIAVSEAQVMVGGRSESGKRTAKTAVDGTFTVKGCPPRMVLVTAEAKGYATTTIELADAGSEPVRLVLQRGRALRLRVVNQAGQPIAGANVWLDTFRNGPINAPRTIPVQASFNPRTDQHGMVVWSNAPDLELQFAIAASGYMRTNELRVRPDDGEHLVTLAPAVVVSGQVTDANTGKLIPRFRVICGSPRQDVNGTAGFSWSNFERDWLAFTGGTYRHAFEDAMIHGTRNPGYALKFEAEGYAPFVSRAIKADEGELRLDVMLTPAASMVVGVLLPAGQPAAGADVGLVSRGTRLELVPGGFNRENVQTGGSLMITDKQGQFRLPADESIQTVMVAHPVGFAQVSRAELAAREFIQLQPWGRLEGLVLKGGKPAADQEFLLQFEQTSFGDVAFSFTAFRVTSDEEGRFIFAQVPPGKLKLVRLVREKNPQHGTVWTHQPLQAVEVSAGQTAQVTIGGPGHTVTVRLRWPDGSKNSSPAQIVGSMHTPAPAWMMEMAQNPKQAVDMAQLPEAQEFMRNARQFQMELNPDGTLTAESVSPGEFELTVYAMFNSGLGGTNLSGMTGRTRVTVPADPPSGTLDAGEIQLQAFVPPLPVGKTSEPHFK